MATAPHHSSVCEKAVASFRSGLTEDERKTFRSTTMADVEAEIRKIQFNQGPGKRLPNMSRLTQFVEAMSQIEKVVTIFLNASEVVAFVWGPIKFVLVMASSHLEIVNRLLDTYAEIGSLIPRLQYYESVFKHSSDVLNVLERYICDILTFHTKAMAIFRRKAWKQFLSSFWKTFRVEIEPILQSLQRNKELLESDKVTAIVAAVQDGNKINQEGMASLKVLIREFSTSVREKEASDAQKHTSHRAEEMMKIQSSIKEKLNAPNYLEDHERATEQHFEDSGNWIFANSRFEAWSSGTSKDPQGQYLYLHGKPGTGKSIMVSHIIEGLKSSHPTTPVLFFYFRHNDENKTSFAGLLRSLLVQIINADSGLFSFFHEECGPKTRDEICQLSNLKRLTLRALKAQSSCYIILDGLDECGGPARQLSATSEMIINWFMDTAIPTCDLEGTTARVLFSGQRDGVLDRMLGHIPNIGLDREISHGQDITKFTQLKAASLRSRLTLSKSQETSIVNKISTAAGGMFLYARLLLEILDDENSEEDFHRASDDGLCPETLEGVYARIFDRVFVRPSARNRSAAEKIVRWVMCAGRPLLWREVQTLFCIDLDDSTCSFSRHRTNSCKAICGSFIEVENYVRWPGANSELRMEMVHQSATRYLVQRHFDMTEQHTEMALFCSRYLVSRPFELNLSAVDVSAAAMSGYYGLHDYAVAFWLYHMRKVSHHERNSHRPLPHAVRVEMAALLSHYDFPHAPDPDNEKSTETILERLIGFPGTEVPSLPELETRTTFIRDVIERIDLSAVDALQQEVFGTLHGSITFKCSKPHCPNFSTGFKKRESREKHMAQHERPFKCVVDSCLHTKLGFTSASDLSQHKTAHHSAPSDSVLFPSRRATLTWTRDSLQLACLSGNVEFIRSQIAQRVDILASFQNSNMGPLAFAARGGHLQLCRLLIQHGAKVFSGHTTADRSPIEAAVYHKDGEFFGELVFEAEKAGQSPSEIRNHWTLVRLAYKFGTTDILLKALRWFSSAPRGPKRLSFSKQLHSLAGISTTQPNCVRNLNQIFDNCYPKTDPTKCQRDVWYPELVAKDHGGKSALYLACYWYAEPVVAFLLDLLDIDDVRSTNSSGETPLHGLLKRRWSPTIKDGVRAAFIIPILRLFLEKDKGHSFCVRDHQGFHPFSRLWEFEKNDFKSIWDALVELGFTSTIAELAATSPNPHRSALKAFFSASPLLLMTVDSSEESPLLVRAINSNSHLENISYLLTHPEVVESLNAYWPRLRDLDSAKLTRGLLLGCLEAGRSDVVKRILNDGQLQLEVIEDHKFSSSEAVLSEFEDAELVSLLASRGVLGPTDFDYPQVDQDILKDFYHNSFLRENGEMDMEAFDFTGGRSMEGIDGHGTE